MKVLTAEEMRSKHQIGVNGIFMYLVEKSPLCPYLTSSMGEDMQDDRFARYTQLYDSYERVVKNGISYSKNKEAIQKKAEQIIKKYSKRQYVEYCLEKPHAVDYIYFGDMQYRDPVNPDRHNKVSLKIANSVFLNRWATHRSKADYIILYNEEDIGKSKVFRHDHVRAYFSSICSENTWKKMPQKKKTRVFQNFSKMKNFCYLEDFIQSYTLFLLDNSNPKEDAWDKHNRIEHHLFVKVRSKKNHEEEQWSPR